MTFLKGFFMIFYREIGGVNNDSMLTNEKRA